MDTGHGDRSLQPWYPTATPRSGGDMSVEQLQRCMNGALRLEAPRRSSPIPVVPGLGPAPAASQHHIQPPVPPPSVRLWDGRRVLCRGLSRRRSPESAPALGPGGDSGSPDLATLTQHPGTATDPPPPPSTPIGSSGGATPTPKPWDTPAPAGHAPEGSSRRCCAFGFALLAFHALVQTSPAALTPGRGWGVGSALLYPCPSKGMVGWNLDGR